MAVRDHAPLLPSQSANRYGLSCTDTANLATSYLTLTTQSLFQYCNHYLTHPNHSLAYLTTTTHPPSHLDRQATTVLFVHNSKGY